jgi:mRNA-degrading endonuclease YafQ of YafQ-DinJ toxin-antitoxin module
MRVFPDLPAKISKFVETKKDNPLMARFGKHDSRMIGTLAGLWHCHLRDDAVLIYCLKNKCIHLIAVVSHADIEGKRLRATAARFKNAGEMVEGLADRIIASVLSRLW